MNEAAMHAYTQMLEEINAIDPQGTNEIQLVERCFNIALHYHNLIKANAEKHLFKQQAAEICFFKHIKPLFAATVEYYTLRYQSIFFRPVNDKGELAQFWLQQLKRVDLFYRRHAEFYTYYTNNQTDRDEMYFSRPQYTVTAGQRGYHQKRSVNSYVHIAASILAYGQYREYVNRQLEKLSCNERSLIQPVFEKHVLYHCKENFANKRLKCL